MEGKGGGDAKYERREIIMKVIIQKGRTNLLMEDKWKEGIKERTKQTKNDISGKNGGIEEPHNLFLIFKHDMT